MKKKLFCLVCGKESFVLINYKCKACNAKKFKKNQKKEKKKPEKNIRIPPQPLDESLLYEPNMRPEYFRRKYG